ncbi:24644_t:CDS:1, partial [Gigaspora margarita]
MELEQGLQKIIDTAESFYNFASIAVNLNKSVLVAMIEKSNLSVCLIE